MTDSTTTPTLSADAQRLFAVAQRANWGVSTHQLRYIGRVSGAAFKAAVTELTSAGLIELSGRGYYRLTDKGLAR